MRGMSKCRICGKSIPSIYRKRHETMMCLRMRKLRGDANMLFRELPKTDFIMKPLFELPIIQRKISEYR